MGNIKDSGNRTEFETGAVRDMQDGKGRLDLVPLNVVAQLYRIQGLQVDKVARLFDDINDYIETLELYHLYSAVLDFIGFTYLDIETALIEVSKHFEDGAKKYGEHNWQKGLPMWCYINSATRHLIKYLRGDSDENHPRAVLWNLICAIWTAIAHPELNTFKRSNETNES